MYVPKFLRRHPAMIYFQDSLIVAMTFFLCACTYFDLLGSSTRTMNWTEIYEECRGTCELGAGIFFLKNCRYDATL
jgi:hypothetical protein